MSVPARTRLMQLELVRLSEGGGNVPRPRQLIQETETVAPDQATLAPLVAGTVQERRQREATELRPRSPVDTLDLSAQWRACAETLRAFGAATQAEAVERCAMELEQALTANHDELLSLQQAARISGYSADHLGRLIRQGSLRNVGRPRAPRLRRGDLPRKAATLPVQAPGLHLPGADPRQVARAVVTSRKGQR